MTVARAGAPELQLVFLKRPRQFFLILHSKISHETNKQGKSSYKKPRCSLDLSILKLFVDMAVFKTLCILVVYQFSR
jgi:hypothetical protein